MALKHTIDNLDEVPEAIREHYTEANGKFVLDCEGVVPAARLNEFRDNNVKLKKDLEAFAGIDPKRYAELTEKEKTFENASADNAAKVDELVKKRTDAMAKEYGTKIQELEELSGKQAAKLQELQIDQAVLAQATELGLRKTAAPDLVARAHQTFKLEDGKVVAYDANGEKIYGANGEPITTTEWLQKLAKDAGHLFEENQGSGSGGGGKGGAGGSTGEANPWAKATWNLTKQGQILSQDKDKARRMAAQAGVTLR